MGNPAAIIVGSLIIAAAILFSLRWEAFAVNNGVLRLDRWTGTVVGCAPAVAGGRVRFDCEP